MLAGRKVVAMLLQYLVLLAVASMAILAVARVVRVHLGRTPFPDVRGRFLLVFAFLVGPPIVAGAVFAGEGPLGGFSSVPAYLLVVLALATLMACGALVAHFVAPGRSRPLLLLALVGREADPDDAPFDPPATPRLAESAALVDRANAAFPRGSEFPAQIDRPGFREDWNALDAATATLEGRIADDGRLGVAVASGARATATDARSRLDTLRRLALGEGQTWAS